MQAHNSREAMIWRMDAAGVTSAPDLLAVEEPLEIRLACTRDGRREQKILSITMRTPGDDFDLAVGFLLGEGVIRACEAIADLRACGRPAPGSDLRNVVHVELKPDVGVDWKRLERHFYTTSSCGVCGKTSLEALEVAGCPLPLQDDFRVAASVIHGLPALLRGGQAGFDRTGGLHAAALFDAAGNLETLREDVGRHNALDKLIGAQARAGRTALSDRILLVSGRASFELLQKALMAGIPILAAVGAPSSLAVDLARQFHITLLGFVREQRFNIYSAPERICEMGEIR